MTITTDKGTKIKINGAPEWNDFHHCYYANGFRWIATKQKFSSQCLTHNFKTFKVAGE